MEHDNVMPNDGTYYLPREPVEQQIDRKKERAKTLEGKTILKEVLDHLEQRIAFYNSVDSIPKEVKADPEKFLMVFNANQLTRNNLVSEKEFVISLLDNSGISL